MAIALTNALVARQKALNFLTAGIKGTTQGVGDPSALYAVKSWFLNWAANKGNADLQFIPFSAANIVTGGGYSPDVDACKYYVFYGRNSGAGNGTDAYVTIFDGTTNAGTELDTAIIQDDYDTFLIVRPNGIAIATELTVAASPVLGGDTESGETNACDGFVIIGAA